MNARPFVGAAVAIVTTCLLISATEPQSQEEEPGFASLFDGKTLEGWVTEGGRYDGHATWNVEDGALVGRQGPGGRGGLLYTARKYACFVLRLEARIDYPFDSGIFLRMAPEGKGAQITLDYRPDGEVGGIYSDGYLQHNEEGKARFRRDEWNELEVRCTGFDMRIEFWLNGELLTDYQLPAGSPGYAPTGLIGLQVHGGRQDEGVARFRNIRIKPLPVFALHQEGWQPLFDGESLEGWQVAGEDGRYVVEDGAVAFRAVGGGGQLETVEDFTDFRLRLDFKTSKMANSGVFLRAARGGSNPAFSGCELQILDDFNWETVTSTKLRPWQLTGSLYGSVPAGNPEALNPIGEWNTYEILYQGARLAVALNGHVLYDVDTLSVGGTPPFAERAKTGFIGLQHHGAHNIEAETMVWFRNVSVQRLDG